MPGCRRRKTLRKHQQPLRRRDVLMRMIVDMGIHYAQVLGLEHASAFMRSQNIPETVIQRVFQAADLRRQIYTFCDEISCLASRESN